MKKYIIVEIIPDGINPKKGKIIQMSALKINDLKLLDRFDYRLNEEKYDNIFVKDMVQYDKDKFNYVDDAEDILKEFKKWSKGYKLLIIDNLYTENFLMDYKTESVLKLLGFEYSDDVINKIVDKYKLESSNYIVDLLYEALIYESNNKKS